MQAKNEDAVKLGKLGGLSRARNLSPAERKKIASIAARARWNRQPKAKPKLDVVLGMLETMEFNAKNTSVTKETLVKSINEIIKFIKT